VSARVLKIRASSHREALPNALSRFVIPVVRAETEPKGCCSQKKGKGRGRDYSRPRKIHTRAYIDTSCKSGRKGRPALVRSVSAFCVLCVCVCGGQLRAGDFSSRNSHHGVQVPPPPPVGLADSPSAFCCLEVAVLRARVCAAPRGRF
jgi:hypothetical protein